MRSKELSHKKTQPKSAAAIYKWIRRILVIFMTSCGVLVLSWLWPKSSNFQINKVTVDGHFSHIDAAAIKKKIAPVLASNFFNLQVPELKANLKNLPGVKNVEIRRLFPNELVITIEEQIPVAHWNQNEWVNAEGEVFSFPSTYQPTSPLPQLTGPPQQQKALLTLYKQLEKKFAALALHINGLQMSDRGSYQLSIAPHTKVMLGREKIDERLNKFIKVYPKLVKDANLSGTMIYYVDLRYPNGLALKQESQPLSPEEWQMLQVLNSQE